MPLAMLMSSGMARSSRAWRQRGWDINDLNLPDHDTVIALCFKASRIPYQSGHIADCRHNGGLFDDHWNDNVLGVDHKVDSDRQGQSKGADYVFDHHIGVFQRQ